MLISGAVLSVFAVGLVLLAIERQAPLWPLLLLPAAWVLGLTAVFAPPWSVGSIALMAFPLFVLTAGVVAVRQCRGARVLAAAVTALNVIVAIPAAIMLGYLGSGAS